ncbi:MAG: hypothetical protein M1818_000579 [Claussenomyces sp. TS43310]|nr:MAG: hypothetical protein M1818_000579 [Claussenomyces sp. TS43310]
MTPEATAITALARYKAMHRCQKLCDILWPERYNPGQEKDFNSRERIHLAPRDQWEYHASAIQFPEWQQQDPRPLFWISGPESAEGLSWVSSFSVDLIDALAINESLATTYVFCRNGWDQLWTPALVLKRMIAQVLEAFHQIVIDHVSVLSTRRFRDLGDNAWEAWDLFCDILGILQDIMTQRGSELYIVIDRLDLCKTIDEDFSVKSHFIPLLQGLSQNYKATRVVLTSTVQAERLETLHQGEKLLRSVWIDVEHAVSMDDANAYDEWD